MLHKRGGIILGCVLTLITILNGSTEPLSKAEKAFYKNHQDAFIQKKIWDEPTEKLSCPSQICLDALIFLIPAALGAVATPQLGFTDEFLHVRQLVVAITMGSFFVWIYKRRTQASLNEKAFKDFFENYHSNPERLGDNNFKHYLPEKLVETFDTLFEKYRLNPDFTSDEFNLFAQIIQNEILKNNPELRRDTINTALLIVICLAAIVLIATNTAILTKTDRGMHVIRDNIDYWGMSTRIFHEMPDIRQRI